LPRLRELRLDTANVTDAALPARIDGKSQGAQSHHTP
jgi:hypothetical protein